MNAAMDQSQLFRVLGTTQIVKIPIQHVDGQNVIYWESIEQAFPGVRHVKHGEVAVSVEKDSKGLRIIPSRIKHCAGAVLGVALSTPVDHIHVNPSAVLDSRGLRDTTDDTLSTGQVADGLNVVSPAVESTSVARPSFQQIVNLTSKKAQVCEIEQRLISSLDPAIQRTVQASLRARNMSVQAHNEGRMEDYEQHRNESDGHFQELKEILVKNADMAAHTATLMLAKQDEQSATIDLLRIQSAKSMQELNAKQDEVKQLQIQNAEAMQAKHDELNAKQDKIIQLEIQALDDMKKMRNDLMGQFAVLQSRIQAVLTQTYELHEYPIPRLFVVLPQDPSRWHTMNPLSNKFRLYFLCECGEHTKSINSQTKIPHHIHLAKHEGYEIARPSEFFQQYGSYVVTVLKILKLGINVAGVAVPALPLLINTASIDQVTASLQKLQEHIELGVDRTIGHIDNLLAHDNGVDEEADEQVNSKEALEGADLRKLDTFLKGSDGNKVLGNLYRTVTDKGHVKWVCIDHYRENYNQTAAEVFRRTIEAIGGTFDENTGTAKVKLQSRVLSEQFYSGLQKAKSVYELDISLDMEGTRSDLEALADALKTSNVSILHLHLREFRPSLSSKLKSTLARYDVLCRIIEHPNMKMVHIVLPRDFIDLSIFPSKTPSHLRKLSLEMKAEKIGVKSLGLLSEALKTNSTVATLDLWDNSIGDDGAKTLAEALKTNRTVATLNLSGNSIGSDGAKALAEALKTNRTVATLNLAENSIGNDGAKALAEALKTNSSVATLCLRQNMIGSDGAKALAEALKTNSAVATLNLAYNSIGSGGANALAEALKTNSTVTTLNLAHNSIGDYGARALAEALKTNRTMATLNLWCNSIGNDGANALTEALKTKKTVATLNLDFNSIGHNAMEALDEALKANKTVTLTIRV
ncbi:hypothetical protein EC968_008315 [Mortierella alpina]|nr:hypothetical protein EC968_008315 [Mortierella alpina]